MVRTIAAVILGYLTLAVVVMVTFAAVHPVLGVDRLFNPGTYDPSAGWIALSFLLGVISAVAGGWIAARVAPGTSAPVWLAALVFVLGAVVAVPAIMNSDERGGPRPEGVTMSEAMTNARQPGWVALLNPVIGAAGVFLGAGWHRRRH